jgi:hypothetical protein
MKTHANAFTTKLRGRKELASYAYHVRLPEPEAAAKFAAYELVGAMRDIVDEVQHSRAFPAVIAQFGMDEMELRRAFNQHARTPKVTVKTDALITALAHAGYSVRFHISRRR